MQDDGVQTTDKMGAVLLAIGAASVIVTSALYVSAPLEASMQVLALPPGSQSAAQAGSAFMRWAGTSGILGNLVMAAGALLLAIDHQRHGRSRAAGGWALIVMSGVIFEIVDGLFGFALPVAAKTSPDIYGVVRSLYAAFFLAGTFLFGAAALLAIVPAAEHGWRRWLAWSAVVEGVVAMASAGAGILGIAAATPLVGISIGSGAVTFAIIGIDMAATRRKSSRPLQGVGLAL